MKGPRSLLGQFVLLHIAVAIIAAVTLWLSATALLHQTADHFQRDLLRRQVQTVVASLNMGEQFIRPTMLTDGMAVALIGLDKKVDSISGPPRPEILAAAPLDRAAHFFQRGAVEGYSVPVSSGWIVASQDGTDPEVVTDDIVATFLKRFALNSLPIAALIPLIGVWLTRRLTLRMRAVSAIAETIGPRAAETRLPLGTLPLEVEPLAKATNAALDRLGAALHVQAAFAADVAHELRTPLAIVRLRADAITDPEVRAGMMAAVDRAARVIAQLLALAELEQPNADAQVPVDLQALAEHVVADRAPAILTGERSIALEVAGDAVTARGYPEAITLALENLIDNALKHTTPGTAIVVQVGPGARFSVHDDGAAVPEEHLARLTDRLWRGGGDHPVEGSGIGLSIVKRIARAHDGTLTVRRGNGGRGLTFEITLA